MTSGATDAVGDVHGVLAAGVSSTAVRLVTHLDVDDAGIDRAIEAMRQVATSFSSAQ